MNAFRIRQLLGSAAAIVLLAGVFAEPVQAQQGTVAGQVTDKSNQQPVAGASVLIVGTSLQGRTSREGRYTVTNVPVGRYTVQVRLIGYATTTQPVTVAGGESATLDFALTAAAVPLDAIVVSATGQEQLKRELGNNVPTIDAAKVAQQSLPTNAADLLNSRVPGVEVMQSGGTTGTGSRIRIRGSTSLSLANQPITTLDGVRVDNTPNADGNLGVGGQAPSRLNDFNPDDFEAIEVVKGPSAAALYGTDAANGVIQFRTKQGRPGPTKWNAYVEGGTLNDRANWPANYFSRRASGTSCRLTSQAAGACTIVGVDSFNPLKQNSPFREGVRQHYGLSASGGTEVTTFYISGDFQREKGIYESNDLKKTNLRANIRNQISRLLDLTATVGYVTSNVALPQNDNNDQGIASSGLLGFPWDTVAPTGNPSNPALPAVKGGYRFLTPAQANLISTTQRVERFTGGLNLNFRPASFLTMRGTAGYDISNQGDNELTPPNVIPLDQARLDGQAFQYRAQIFSYTANFATTASFRVSPIVTSNTTVGVQYYKNVYQQTQASGRKVVAGTTALGGVVVPTVGDTTAPAVTLGGYVQEEVGLRDRLYITGALRADKHSAFGTNFSDIIYPKLSGSWVISEEPFFPHPSWLGSLRLRAAWGKSGRAPGVLDALQFFRPVAVAVNGTDAPGITIGGAGNANLKPEQTREIEAGFDADLINQRVHFEATYYNKNSKDALVAVPVAPSLGVSFTRFDNLGEVSNKGIELLVTAQLVNTPNVSWSITAGGWGNKNRVLSTGPGNTPIIFGLGGSTQRHQVGFSAGGYWGTPYTFRDLNGDGIIDPATDMTFAASDTFQGSSVPTRGATFSTDITLMSHFTFHGLLDGRWGNKLDNSTESFRCLFGICAGIRVPGTSLADQAAAQAALAGIETGYFQDAGFLKLREVSVTYTAPAQWASRIGASTLSLTVSGRNLVTWTNYRGVDPEVNDAGQFNFSVADFLTQPPVRQFIARMNVTF
jgi:TonB-linked SusC/RagA family outer membrane protein